VRLGALSDRARRLVPRPVRSLDIGPLQDTFLIAAVTMIIVIRLQLWATNYPQLGGGRLHIAHLLWGGLFMLIAIGLLLSLAGRGWRRPAAVIGGVGFGFFIDELGKFVSVLSSSPRSGSTRPAGTPSTRSSSTRSASRTSPPSPRRRSRPV